MRRIFIIALVFVFPGTCFASEAPDAQIHIGPGEVLRGQFVDERQVSGADKPLLTTGRFVITPSHGLLWSIEKPLLTTTIITPNAIAQDLGGLAIKLPAKNLQHLYAMVGGALAGDWNAVDSDFIVTGNIHGRPWHMLLTARPNLPQKQAYATITVSGGQFVENIVMTKTDGTSESFAFSAQTLAHEPMLPAETALFAEIKP